VCLRDISCPTVTSDRDEFQEFVGYTRPRLMTLTPYPSLDLVLGLPVALLLGCASFAIGTFLIWGRLQRKSERSDGEGPTTPTS